MKTINIGLHVLLVLIITSTLSCKKDSGGLSQVIYGDDSDVREIHGVISSDWFYISDWIPEPGTDSVQQYVYNKGMPAISAKLQIGKILVFGKGETDTKVNALPFIFDQTRIGVEKQPGNLKFRIAFLAEHRVSSFGVSFKYILIPADELAPVSHLDYNDYSEVCNYYSIPR